MPQSLVSNYLHIIFSTKRRAPIIRDDIKDELFRYLGGICKNHECFPVKIGGYHDHVHIVCILSKKIALVNLLEHLKAHSSKWIKSKGPTFKDFAWQSGYGAFSVRPADIDDVRKYIERQHEHHASKSFVEEYRELLKENMTSFDERYVWD